MRILRGLQTRADEPTYLDRACIGTLAPDILRDLGLSKDQPVHGDVSPSTVPK